MLRRTVSDDAKEAEHRARTALRVLGARARRARLAPAARLRRRDRGAVAQRPVAARQLREEPPAAARRLRRPARRVLLRRRRGRPGRPRHDVAAAAAADAQHDGARPRCRRPPRCWPTRCAATCCPCASDRLPGAAASHPYAARDSLHEHEMWAVEGLTHRYPTKVLAELLSTCPQYCGHCTRMDLVGNSTPAVPKLKFELKPVDRQGLMLEYLRRHPRRPGRRRLRRRRGQPAVQEPRGVRRRPAGDRVGPRHPAGDQGAHGHAPALAAGRRRRGHDPAGDDRAGPRGLPRRAHARQRRAVGDPAGRRGRAGDAGGRRARRPQPGRAAARASTTRRPSCSTCASRCSTAPRSRPTTSTCAT